MELQYRSLRAVHPATRTLEGAGVPIRRALPPPSGRYDLVDPFLLLDEVELSPNGGPSFPPHPHRGFEILTYALTGGMSHTDSEGNTGHVGAGGLQHIMAGKGMWHGEEIDPTAGPMRGIQMWINLARAEKGREPGYTLVDGPAVPSLTDGAVTTRYLAGDGASVAFVTPAIYRDMHITDGGHAEIEIVNGWQGFVYILDGGGMFGSTAEALGPTTLGILDRVGTLNVTAGPGGVRFLLGAGQPIGEQPRWRGPYVD